MTWMPSVFSFATGSFDAFSHIAGVITICIIAFLSLFFSKKRRHVQSSPSYFAYLLIIIPVLLLGIYLFSTHILQNKDGGLYVGQTTYGDLAMHLGFITSIAVQKTFPPNYNIFPGHSVNYPFLCEVSSSSLFYLGTDLRTSYLIPSIYAFILVLLGVYFLLRSILKKPVRAVLAFYLFFIAGGFGFAYFLDGLKVNSTVSKSLGDYFATNLQQILDGYYTTPTNLPSLGLRWVNPIVDMLIPQRATLFGWAFLFPCLILLYEFRFEQRKTSVFPLAIFAGGLPLIHTHSFLALGIISGVYCIEDLIISFDKKRFKLWLFYGLTAIILALPQLIPFTFSQVGESGMVTFHFNWANERDSWFWYYIKNWGIMFLLLIPGMLLLGKKNRLIMYGPIFLWIISEFIVFQPNTYDNNKLIFIFYLFLCGLTAKLICTVCHFLQRKLFYATFPVPVFIRLCFGLSVFFLVFLLGAVISTGNNSSISRAHLATLLFVDFSIFYFAVKLCIAENTKKTLFFISFLLACVSLTCFAIIAYYLIRYRNTALISKSVFLNLFLPCISLIIFAITLTMLRYLRNKTDRYSGAFCVSQIASLFLMIVIFLSGILTISRECISSYMIFNTSDLEAADYIKSNTEPDSVFLTSSEWHLNVVSVLTGRNIVCGSDLYLFYHGIDTSSRKTDVRKLFENPEENASLFKKYNVNYIYLGNDETSAYNINVDWFKDNCDKVYDSGTIVIYKVGQSVNS